MSMNRFNLIIWPAKIYADQVELDFRTFKAAIRSGRLRAKTTKSGLKISRFKNILRKIKVRKKFFYGG
jgi:hypothetical protein